MRKYGSNPSANCILKLSESWDCLDIFAKFQNDISRYNANCGLSVAK